MKKVLLLLLLPVLALFAPSCETEDTGAGDVPAPYISGVTSDFDNKAVSGKPVTLTGENFSPKASENLVLYGMGASATSLRVTESSENHVVFTAPEIAGTQLKIRVSTNGKESNSFVLEFDNSWGKEDAEDTEDVTVY